jgi:hypothetical protein
MEGKNVQNHGCCIAWGQQHATPAAAAAAACCRVMVQCVGSTQSALHRNYYGGDEQGKREMSLAGGWLSGRVSGLSRPVGGGDDGLVCAGVRERPTQPKKAAKTRHRPAC